MILDEIYLFLKEAGHAQTHAVFSTQYLGHSFRYYDYLRCSSAPPSLKSLVKVALRLSELSKVATGLPERESAADLAQRTASVISERFR